MSKYKVGDVLRSNRSEITAFKGLLLEILAIEDGNYEYDFINVNGEGPCDVPCFVIDDNWIIAEDLFITMHMDISQ
jgi:hypothetical protein